MAQSLLLAAAKHDVIAVKNLLRNTSANVQDAETGFTPLHAAIAACGSHEVNISNGKVNHADKQNQSRARPAEVSRVDQEAAGNVVKLLLENGAIWNDLDSNNETPGCVAFRLSLRQIYEQIVEAGVRAELLLEKLDQIQSSNGDEDGEDDDDDDDADETMDDADTTDDNAAEARITDQETAQTEQQAHASAPLPGEPPEDYIDHWDSNNDFLRSSLRFTDKQLLDSSSNAVMMDWETEIMAKHADRLIPKSGLRVMNVGHGMGIVDTKIQSHAPAEHHIIEAHPAVIEQMRANGWFEKPGVHVHQGRWQDVVPKLIEDGVVLDGMYYDTFAEDYKALRDFFNEAVIGLLDSNGLFGFYHGLGADRQVCYDVYTKVSTCPGLIYISFILISSRSLSLIFWTLDLRLRGKNCPCPQSSGRVSVGHTGTSTSIDCRPANSLDEDGRPRHIARTRCLVA